MKKITIDSPIGKLEICEENERITRIEIASAEEFFEETETPLLLKAKEQLSEYFTGKRKTFDFTHEFRGTDFQKSVWRELEKIPFGRTKTYGEIAAAIGKPKAARAVGSACNKNHILIAVPCHRVIGAGGNLTGFACGIDKKTGFLIMKPDAKRGNGMKLEWKTCAKAAVSIFALYIAITCWDKVAGFIGMVIGAASPLFIGGGIAYIVNLLMSFYEKKIFGKTKNPKAIKAKRPVCMILAFITLAAVVAIIIGLVLPQFVSAIMIVVDYVPEAAEWVANQLDKLEYVPQDIIDMLTSIDWKSQIEKIAKAVTSGVGSVMGVVISTVSTVIGGIVTAFLSIIFTVYILLDKEKLGSQADRITKKYLRKSWYEKIRYFLATFDDCFHKYIVGQCTEAVILGILCTIGMWILGLPYASMIGALVAFTALIPVAGAFIGGAIGAFMILMVNPVQALIFVVFLVVLQQLEGNIIYPKVVGSSMGLPAIWVLAAVTVGGGVFGIMGMFIGVPIAATAYRIISNDVGGRTEEEIKKALE